MILVSTKVMIRLNLVVTQFNIINTRTFASTYAGIWHGYPYNGLFKTLFVRYIYYIRSNITAFAPINTHPSYFEVLSHKKINQLPIIYKASKQLDMTGKLA